MHRTRWRRFNRFYRAETEYAGTMPTNNQKMVILLMLSIYAATSAYAQVESVHLQELVELSDQRLVIAEQVALAKWDKGMPVEDASREDHVIGSATKAGQSRGLDPASVSNFFRAQIEANELVQYSLFAEWYREGRAPDHTPVDLAGTTRPELDEVDEALIVELAQSKVIRGSASCRTDIAKAPQRCGEPSSLLQMVGWFLASCKNSINCSASLSKTQTGSIIPDPILCQSAPTPALFSRRQAFKCG